MVSLGAAEVAGAVGIVVSPDGDVGAAGSAGGIGMASPAGGVAGLVLGMVVWATAAVPIRSAAVKAIIFMSISFASGKPSRTTQG